jgi:hypothetical protein
MSESYDNFYSPEVLFSSTPPTMFNGIVCSILGCNNIVYVCPVCYNLDRYYLKCPTHGGCCCDRKNWGSNKKLPWFDN